MFTVHVISDLFLKYNEPTPEIEQNLPDVDLVILNGNIANVSKRGMFYIEELCKKYPTTQFVYNYGFTELFPSGLVPKSVYVNDQLEFVNATKFRSFINEDWPKNLTFLHQESKRIVLRNGEKVDIFCAFGYPKVLSYDGRWEDTIWYKNIVMDVTNDHNDTRVKLPVDTSRVNHGDLPVWATQQYINEQNAKEFKLIRNWELTYDSTSGYKILVTHINPLKDSRCDNQKVDFFNIHLDKGLWVSSNAPIKNVTYVGARFISNPGRGIEARSLVITTNDR